MMTVVKIRESLYVHEVIRLVTNVQHTSTEEAMVTHMTWIDVAAIFTDSILIRDLIKSLRCVNVVQKAILTFQKLRKHLNGGIGVFYSVATHEEGFVAHPWAFIGISHLDIVGKKRTGMLVILLSNWLQTISWDIRPMLLDLIIQLLLGCLNLLIKHSLCWRWIWATIAIVDAI